MGKIKSYVHLHSLNLHLFLTLKIDQVEGKKKICHNCQNKFIFFFFFFFFTFSAMPLPQLICHKFFELIIINHV